MMSVLKRMLAIGAAALLLPLSACGFVYHAEPIEGWVVDAETNQPLEGVNIVAHWQLRGGVMEDNPIAQIHIDEAVTDRNGRYTFKGWGPKFALLGHLRDETPGLMFFKSGYKYFGTSNMPGSDTSKSDWNKKTVKLERFKGAAYELKYENNFEYFNGELERIATREPEACNWKKIPNAIRAMNRERSRLIGLGVNPNTLSSIDNELLMNDQFYTKKGGCGSPKEFFGGFNQ